MVDLFWTLCTSFDNRNSCTIMPYWTKHEQLLLPKLTKHEASYMFVCVCLLCSRFIAGCFSLIVLKAFLPWDTQKQKAVHVKLIMTGNNAGCVNVETKQRRFNQPLLWWASVPQWRRSLRRVCSLCRSPNPRRALLLDFDEGTVAAQCNRRRQG